MTHRGPYSNDAFDSEESSGVTSTMTPVPAKTARLSDLDESDRTAYFSVTALMERGKAVSARSEPPPAEAAPSAPRPESALPEQEPALVPKNPGILEQLRDASMVRKATLVVLPLLIALLAVTPIFKQAPPAESSSSAVSSAQLPAVAHPQHVAQTDPKPLLAEAPAEPPPVPPKGTTLERAAADALAAGEYSRALGFYRELSRRDPNSVPYREATRILERRKREQQP